MNDDGNSNKRGRNKNKNKNPSDTESKCEREESVRTLRYLTARTEQKEQLLIPQGYSAGMGEMTKVIIFQYLARGDEWSQPVALVKGEGLHIWRGYRTVAP